MGSFSIALASALLLGFPMGDFEPPTSPPAPRPTLPGIGPSARDVGQLRTHVRSDINSARRNHQLSHEDAKNLRRQIRYIDALESRYAEDGLSEPELRELRNRLEAVESLNYAKSSPLAPE